MKLKKAQIINFRRLENVLIDLDSKETLFVGPNNSGKTSATSVFRCFLGKRDFSIHDFPLKRLEDFDNWNPNEKAEQLPEIELNLWFSLDPAKAPYAKASTLITRLEGNVDEVGIGCTFKAVEPDSLWHDYDKIFPMDDEGNRKQPISQFLKTEGRLKKYFRIHYSSLNQDSEDQQKNDLSPKDGKQALQSLLRIDFVDAQRNLQDDELTNRGSRLSAAFTSFYRANLEQAEAGEDTVQIVENYNNDLTNHYGNIFDSLMSLLQNLGVPSATERKLKIVSALQAQEVLKGTIDLVYTETGANHSLPEEYNGLGFKNLILMALQVRDYQLQWATTEENRPLCHIIFIEEPEVHLHVQVQQTFISNMWSILNDLSQDNQITPQLVVTTHSSHILNTIDFEKVRYFRRSQRNGNTGYSNSILPISEVYNLRDFKISEQPEGNNIFTKAEALAFLKKYMTLTHCDLLFADAAVLIEGTAERLLLPAMIKKEQPTLNASYLTILEVGGAYAHIFSELLSFLKIPYLIIADLDSVKLDPDSGKKKACCADESDAETSNAVLKFYFPSQIKIQDLKSLDSNEKIQDNGNLFVTFQQPVKETYKNLNIDLYARTFEEALIFENLSVCGKEGFLRSIDLPEEADKINKAIFTKVHSSSFKKTEFALGTLAEKSWTTPKYICEGLKWLSDRLKANTNTDDPNET